MIPPFSTPLNASYFACGFHSATISSSFRYRRTCKPFGFAGPQPKQTFRGAYSSWSDWLAFIDFALALARARYPISRARKTEDELAKIILATRDTDAALAQRKVTAAGSDDCDRVARSRVRTS